MNLKKKVLSAVMVLLIATGATAQKSGSGGR